ncbi:MAG: hypothetical protein E6R05_03140 [Candidatus Moraniibacteriota bacterium]|nr:MAG: hypothetical protein E6R05_03140 [Candidatus Moranbacteria bacterium]
MADKAIMPTDARTQSRWHLSIEPVEVFDYRDRNEFIAACNRAVLRGIPEVPMPSDADLLWIDGRPELKEPVELKYSGTDNWDDLERKSIFVSVECYDKGFLIESSGRTPKGIWSENDVLELRLSPEVGLEGVVDAILDHLKSRKDMPGAVEDFSQSNTVKGA